MASDYAYGPEVSYWRAYGKWSTSETETAVTASVTVGMQSMGYGIDIQYNTIKSSITFDGTTKAAEGNFYSDDGTWVTTDYTTITKTFAKGTSAYNKEAWANVTNESGFLNGSSTAYMNFYIPALKSYTVAYNANGGSSVPVSQTKWYGQTLKLSSSKPSRTGYIFQGWATSASGSVTYQPGANYTANAAVTLYAIWKAVTYTVSYNANGGSGAPGNQTKTYGAALTLSSTKPTKTNYTFLGWATSASATSVTYSAGGKYTNNASITLYAVWQLAYKYPRISNLTAARSDTSGTLSDTGTSCKVSFSWATDKTVSSITVTVGSAKTTISATGTSGTVNQVVSGTVDTDTQYNVTVTVTDTNGSSSSQVALGSTSYIMDFAPNGSVAIGGPADDNSKSFRIFKQLENRSFYRGFFDSGYFSDGWHYFVLARSKNKASSTACYNHAHLVGEIGGWTTASSLDMVISNRQETKISVNCNPIQNADTVRIVVVENSDGYTEILVFCNSYYSYNISISSSDGFDIVNGAWVTGSNPPSGSTIIFNSGTFDSYTSTISLNARMFYAYGFWGLNEPDTHGSSGGDWIRTTNAGLIPGYCDSSKGQSALGTNLWPFRTSDTVTSYHGSISFNHDYATKHRPYIWWGNNVTDAVTSPRGDMFKLLWSGTLSAGGTITVSGLNKYTLFIVGMKDVTSPSLCARVEKDSVVSDICGGSTSPYAGTYNDKNSNYSGSILLRATAYNTLTNRASRIIQSYSGTTYIDARAVTYIVGVM